MTGEKRPYTMRRRAELEAQTRRRIADSAMELHGTLGPSRTTITAVADRAGVRRSTVYRHFPDEASLFAACSGHWMDLNPPPDIEAWAAIADPDERLRTGLTELYAYFAANEQMLVNLLRDEETVAIVGELFAAFHELLASAADVLMLGRPPSATTRAVLGHAVAFSSWRSLVREQGLTAEEAVGVMERCQEP